MGFQNLCGSWVWVHAGMGMGRDSPTCKLQKKPLFIQNLMVLYEKRLVLKGIPVGSQVNPATGTGMVIYLGCNKDQWRWRSKCISYVVLRGAIWEQ